MIDRVSGPGGPPPPVAPVQPVARTAPAAGAAGVPTGQAGNPMSAAQLVEQRLMQALLTPGGTKALSDEDLKTLSDIVARTQGEPGAAPLSGQPNPYGQITPERAAELLARINPEALQRAYGAGRGRATGARPTNRPTSEESHFNALTVNLLSWLVAIIVAVVLISVMVWVGG